MAYGQLYYFRFKNRAQNDIYRVEFWMRNYPGASNELTGAETPLTANYQETDLLEPIKAVELTINIIAQNEEMLFYTGNADINLVAASSTIVINGQASTTGIRPGMTIVIEDVTYHIVQASYYEPGSQIILTVTETLVDDTLNDTDFTLYQRLSIDAFYSDDDEEFRIDVYCETGGDKLLHSCYLIQDGISEPVTDRKHVLTLKATDNLGLLKSAKWDEAVDEPYGKFSLTYFIQYCLKQTGLYSPDSPIDMNLPLRLFGNIYENTTEDKGDDLTAEPYSQSIIHSGIFLSTDNTWDNCYDILVKILTDLNACIIQADGYWDIVRIPEYQLFTDGEIPGTQFEYTGSGVLVDAVTLTPLVNIARTGGDGYPINEDQSKTKQHPVKYVLNTFRYNQPGSFIIQNDLQLPEGATPFDTNTVGDIRTDKYSIPTYFPEWEQRGGVTSYLETITDTATTPESETDRYIVVEGGSGLTGGVQFNPIEVTAGDKFDFSLRFRTDTDTDDLLRFWVRCILITATGDYYGLTDIAGVDSDRFQWSGPFDAIFWNDWAGIYHELTNPDDIDTTEWMDWVLSSSDFSEDPIPLIPVDGVILIEVRGTNSVQLAAPRQTTYFKDVRLDFSQFINNSTQIVGQTHKDSGLDTPKAISDNELNIDDSPRNTIAGTLFTNATTNFDYTDDNTGQETNIGSLYFTKTVSWHRAAVSESLRLGNIITDERLSLKYISRLIVEGSFRNIKYDTDKFINPLCLFTIDWATGKKFVATAMEIDYMDCSFRATLLEIYNDYDLISDEYLFNYLYKND